MRKSITKIGMVMLVSIATLVFTGCKKTPEKVRGCTTSSALNYNSSAEEDDGSCSYNGSMTFWKYSVGAYGNVDVVVNSTAQGTITVNNATAPVCSATGCVTFTAAPGNYNYTASEHAPGIKTWSGSITITSKGCATTELY